MFSCCGGEQLHHVYRLHWVEGQPLGVAFLSIFVTGCYTYLFGTFATFLLLKTGTFGYFRFIKTVATVVKVMFYNCAGRLRFGADLGPFCVQRTGPSVVGCASTTPSQLWRSEMCVFVFVLICCLWTRWPPKRFGYVIILAHIVGIMPLHVVSIVMFGICVYAVAILV